MVESHLDRLLKLFEPFFGCSLKADENQTCLIQLGSGLKVQIELSREDRILIGCELSPITGRYQELLIKEALKANDLSPPSLGSFGFSQKSSALILFTFIDPIELKTDLVNSLLPAFLAKAKTWQEAIQNNQLPTESEKNEKAANRKMFGL